MSKDRNLELEEGLPISKLKHHVAKFHIGDQVQIPAELLQNDNIVPNSPYMDAEVHSICTHHIVYHLKSGVYVSLDNFRIIYKLEFKSRQLFHPIPRNKSCKMY